MQPFRVGERQVLLVRVPTPESVAIEGLTRAEAEIATLAARGFTTREIGLRRSSSSSTISNQLKAIYSKIGVGSKSELARVLAERAAGGAPPKGGAGDA